jgi:hypothetical protein
MEADARCRIVGSPLKANRITTAKERAAGGCPDQLIKLGAAPEGGRLFLCTQQRARSVGEHKREAALGRGSFRSGRDFQPQFNRSRTARDFNPTFDLHDRTAERHFVNGASPNQASIVLYEDLIDPFRNPYRFETSYQAQLKLTLDNVLAELAIAKPVFQNGFRGDHAHDDIRLRHGG